MSASKNCQAVLAAAGIEALFEVRIDGIVAADKHLRGKPSPLARFIAGAILMAGPAWLTATAFSHWLGQPFGPRLGIAAATVVGAVVFLGAQAIWRTPELGWLAGGLGHMRGKARRGIAEVTHG